MNECKVTFHPVFAEALKNVAELDEERTRLQTVVENETFERVRGIIEAQPARKSNRVLQVRTAGREFQGLQGQGVFR